MNRRQVRTMLRHIAAGQPVQVSSPWGTATRLARLAALAEQFGYAYVHVHQDLGTRASPVMLLVPDPTPEGQERAARTWAAHPRAADGEDLPPLDPAAVRLYTSRVLHDLTGPAAEKRMLAGFVGLFVAGGVLAFRISGSVGVQVAVLVWLLVPPLLLGLAYAVNRRRHARHGARLAAAGLIPVTDERGRVRYVDRAPAQQWPAPGAAPGPYAVPHQGFGPPPPSPGPAQPPPGPARPYGAAPGHNAPQAYGPPGAQGVNPPYGTGPYGSPPHGGARPPHTHSPYGYPPYGDPPPHGSPQQGGHRGPRQ